MLLRSTNVPHLLCSAFATSLFLLAGCASEPSEQDKWDARMKLVQATENGYKSDVKKNYDNKDELFKLAEEVDYDKTTFDARKYNTFQNFISPLSAMERAAELGHPKAIFYAANLSNYCDGADKCAALKRSNCDAFKKADELGVPSVQLANCYKEGSFDGKPDFRKAAEALERAAKADEANPARWIWTRNYLAGTNKYQGWNKDAKDIGYNADDDYLKLSELYRAGGPNLVADSDKAQVYLKKAAAHGADNKFSSAAYFKLNGKYPVKVVSEFDKFYTDATRVVRDMNFKQVEDEPGSGDSYADFTGTYQGYNLTVKMHFYKTGRKSSGVGLEMNCVSDNKKLNEGALEQILQNMRNELGGSRVSSVYIQFPQFNREF